MSEVTQAGREGSATHSSVLPDTRSALFTLQADSGDMVFSYLPVPMPFHATF